MNEEVKSRDLLLAIFQLAAWYTVDSLANFGSFVLPLLTAGGADLSHLSYGQFFGSLVGFCWKLRWLAIGIPMVVTFGCVALGQSLTPKRALIVGIALTLIAWIDTATFSIAHHWPVLSAGVQCYLLFPLWLMPGPLVAAWIGRIQLDREFVEA